MAEVKGSVNITIGANADVLNKVFADAQKRANSFTTNLAKAAALGATAFITLKEGVFGTVQAFAESEAASNRLRAALLNQGMLSAELEETYNGLADQLSLLTGADDDAVKAMFASGQAMLGNIEISEQLTQAVANLAAGTGMELEEAFTKVTKTIGTKTNALAKNGFQIDANMTRQEKLAEVIRMVESRYGGQAEASKNVGTAIASLGVQFGNLREELGARFAPVVEKVVKALTQMIIEIKNRPEILDFIGKLALIGTAGLGVVSAVLAIKAAFATLGPVIGLLIGPLTALLSAMKALALANPITAAITGIIIAGTLLYKHWDSLKLAFQAFVMNIAELGKGLGNVLMGVFTLDPTKFAQGLDQITAYFKNGMAKMQGETVAPPVVDEKALEDALAKKNEANRKARAAEIAEENAHVERLREIAQVKTEALLLQQEVGTKAQIDLKNQEAALIKQIDDETANVEIEGKRARLEALNAMLAQNRVDQLQAENDHQLRMAELQTAYDQAAFDAKVLGWQAEMEFTQAQQNQLFEMALSEQEAKRQVGFEMVKDQIERNNQFLKDQAQFGETYAKLNQALNSREVQGAKVAADELVGLTQSKNATLKSIGKAAAITQIGISTAEAAMNVYKSLSGIPFVGPALAVAGAAAAVAFGAERTAQVMAANKGGVVPGFGPNVDSVPAMLSPGEIVIPKPLAPTFAEQFGNGGGGMGEVVAELQALRGDLNGARPMVNITGDMLTDDVFIDRLIQKISDRLEFGNARLVGVNA